MSVGNTLTRRGLLTSAAGALAAGAAPAAAGQSGGVDYGGWFDGVSNFEGTVDYTGQKEVTVSVGAKGNTGYFAFSAPAIRVDPGTTVTWKWTGKGGGHNVVAKDGSFKSNLHQSKGKTFTHTFEGSGGGQSITKYYCSPHRSLGMKGAVVVGGSGGISPDNFDRFTVSGGSSGGSSGGGEGSSPGTSGGSASANGHVGDLGLAAIVTSGLAAVVSPVFFGTLMVCCRSDPGGDDDSA